MSSTYQIRIATYDISRPDVLLLKGQTKPSDEQDWETRKVKVIQNIEAADPDILMLQKVTNTAHTYIKSQLPDYESRFRTDKFKVTPGVAILYKKKFTALHLVTLSMRNNIKYLILDLQDTAERVYRIGTCYLDNNEKTDQLKHILDDLKKNNLEEHHVRILGGNFDAEDLNNKPLSLLKSENFVEDGSKMMTENPNRHHDKGRQSDWIFVKFRGESESALEPYEPQKQVLASGHKIKVSTLILQSIPPSAPPNTPIKPPAVDPMTPIATPAPSTRVAAKTPISSILATPSKLKKTATPEIKKRNCFQRFFDWIRNLFCSCFPKKKEKTT